MDDDMKRLLGETVVPKERLLQEIENLLATFPEEVWEVSGSRVQASFPDKQPRLQLDWADLEKSSFKDQTVYLPPEVEKRILRQQAETLRIASDLPRK